MDAITSPPPPVNEPVRTYAPGSPERERLVTTLRAAQGEVLDLPMTIAGVQRMGGGDRFEVRAPHRHELLLGHGAHATESDVADAVAAALAAAPMWRDLSFDDRAAVFLRAAD